jgi:hypothetical protein
MCGGFLFSAQALGQLTAMTMVFLFIALMNWTLPVCNTQNAC